MNTLLIYLLKVNIAIALFYIFYRLFFARDTFWKTRRFYLIGTLIISFVYPFFSIENWLQSQEPIQTIVLNYTALPEFTVSAQQTQSSFNWQNFLLYVYLIISLVLLFRLFVQMISIINIKLKSTKSVLLGVEVNLFDQKITPFSFLTTIYINPSMHQSHELEQILTHEQTHVREWHSIDVIVSELVSIAFWLNPFVWLTKREIRQNLEFLADNKVIETGFDIKSYQYNLLQLSYQSPELSLTNKFNVLPLKKRIKMMNQQKTSKAGMLKYLLAIPLALALVLTSNAETLISKAQKALKITSESNLNQSPVVIDELEEIVYANAEPQLKNQNQKPTKEITIDDSKMMNKHKGDNPVFIVVEKMPEFPGGKETLIAYLASSIKYPKTAAENGIQGRVICQFIVDKTGKIDSVKIVRSIHPFLDAEAIRVIKAMPTWIPGEQRGEKVNVRYTLPINFALNQKADNTKTNNQTTAIFEDYEVMPVYPGGDAALFKFLQENVKYPTEAAKKGIQGRVICQFIIEKTGDIDSVKVVRGIDPHLDAEAVRVIKGMPKWTPGTYRGEKVKIKYTLPVNFKLDGEKKIQIVSTPNFDSKNPPLIVLDGNIMPSNFNISNLKPENIEKIDVLKDASATAIYGDKGKNGVIIVHTKKVKAL